MPAMNTLDEVRAEMAAYDAARARSQQVETGASGLFGCRAQTLLRLTGVPESDPRVSWQALVGTAIHAMAESAAALNSDVLVEARFSYKGVPCTIDRFDIAAHKLTDLKSKDDADAIAKVRKYGPSKAQIAQIQTGAAALIDAGYEVDTVELLFLPRAGGLDSAFLWSAPFDRNLADEAVQWSIEQDDRAADVLSRELDPVESLDGLRDEPERFCRDYCEWATVCRGPERQLPAADDPFVIAAAEQYAAGQAMRDEGEALMKANRRDLFGLRVTAGEYKVMTSGGNVSEETVVDMDAVVAAHKEWIGDLPTKTVEKITNTQLRVTRVKAVMSPATANQEGAS